MSSSAWPCSLLVLALLAACGRESPPRADSTQAAKASALPRSEAFPGQFAYRKAKALIQGHDLRAAIGSLEQAIEQNPEFSEAYYQLGAVKSDLAIEEVRYDERSALHSFRDAVAAKKEAHHLMSLNKFYIWDAQQREQAWNDLLEALRDVDAVLADETSLIERLKMYGS